MFLEFWGTLSREEALDELQENLREVIEIASGR